MNRSLLFILLAFPALAHEGAAAGLDLKAYPPSVQLFSARSRQQIVLQTTAPDNVTRDVTSEAVYKIANPKIARLEKTTLVPLTDGRTELEASFGGKSVKVPIEVTNSATHPAVSFKLDVMPVFTRAGCNAGACHGTSRGKDGFHLSLYGFDPAGDYQRLTVEQIGRRVNLAVPEESLIVQKGLGAVQHTGGVRFGTNSDLCQTLIRWLAAGAPEDTTNVAKATGIEIFPPTAVMEGSNTVQRFIVTAH